MKTRFYIYRNDAADGPFTLEQVRGMWRMGAVHGETQVCIEGDEEWTPLGWMEAELTEPAKASRSPLPPPLPITARPKPPTGSTSKILIAIFLVSGLLFWIHFATVEKPAPLNKKPKPAATTSSVPYVNETGYITPGVWTGYAAAEDLEKCRQMRQVKDTEALALLTAAGIATGKATLFELGEEVFVSDYSLMNSSLRVRRRGDPQEYWTFMLAVSKERPGVVSQ